MSISLEIFFSGLMLLAAEPDRKEAMILIANAHTHSTAHHPRLRLHCSSLDPTQLDQLCVKKMPPAWFRLEKCGGDDKFLCIVLDNIDVSILPDGVQGKEGEALFTIKKDPDSVQHGSGDAKDMGWVPELPSILKEPFKIDPVIVPGLLNRPLSMDLQELVAGRVRLNMGMLEAEVFEKGYGVWRFKTKNGFAVSYRQEVLESFTYTAKPARDYFLVRIAKANGNETMVYDLKYIDNAEFEITNEPSLEDFCENEYRRSEFRHFDLFYDLLKDLGDRDLPLPKTVDRPSISCREALQTKQATKEDPGRGLGPVICMSSQMTTPEMPDWSDM